VKVESGNVASLSLDSEKCVGYVMATSSQEAPRMSYSLACFDSRGVERGAARYTKEVLIKSFLAYLQYVMPIEFHILSLMV